MPDQHAPDQPPSLARLSAKFWGVRGSIACTGADFAEFGGNTACLEVRCGDRLLIFDAGTGLPRLGAEIIGAGITEMDLFFSHFHLDHMCGLPFFAPLWRAETKIRVWSRRPDAASEHGSEYGLGEALNRMMSPPLFPISSDAFRAEIDFREFEIGAPLDPGGAVTITTAPLNHPQGCVGYRVDYAGKSIAYVTDTEHFAGRIDDNILPLVRDADIVIYDANYTDAEYGERIGWGHSTWREGVRLCEAGEAGRLVLFHHDPAHDDGAMAEIEREAARARPGTIAAREGMVLNL